ncbi:MAG: hypothetical protein LQ351_007527 [Letrouitia transgressa]|nr:MAG: hypothetical protein LQ351_007527 [Letrouitia transgressa]
MSTPDQDHGNRGENHPDTAPIPNFDYLAIPGPMTHLPSSRLFNASLDRLDQGTLLLSLENVLADIVAVDGESASPGSQLSSARDEIPSLQRPSTGAGQQASTDGHEDASQHTDNTRNDASTVQQDGADAVDSIAHAEQLHDAQRAWHLHQDRDGVDSTAPSTNEAAVTAPTAPTTPQQTERQNSTIQPLGRRSPERISRRRRRRRALGWLQRTIRHPLPWNQNRRHDLRHAVHAVRQVMSRGL